MRLALDTSTTWSSIALVDDGVAVALADIDGVNPGEAVVSRIDQLLKSAGVGRAALTGIVVGVGPGPYTSTRVGVAIARTLGFALGIDVVGVCSHDAIAAEFVAAGSHANGHDFVVATDARRREVYWARYDSSGIRCEGPAVAKPIQVLEGHADLPCVGNGFERYPELVAAMDLAVLPPAHPSAQWLVNVAVSARAVGQRVPTVGPELADHDSGAAARFDQNQRLFAPIPLYLRRPDAVPAAHVVVPS